MLCSDSLLSVLSVPKSEHLLDILSPIDASVRQGKGQQDLAIKLSLDLFQSDACAVWCISGILRGFILQWNTKW